jgi:hypothetical protein
LETGFPRTSRCAGCGGLSREYALNFGTTVKTHGTITTVRKFYENHPYWLVVQVVLILVGNGLGLASLVAGGVAAGVVAIVITDVLALAGLGLPGWRDRVKEIR